MNSFQGKVLVVLFDCKGTVVHANGKATHATISRCSKSNAGSGTATRRSPMRVKFILGHQTFHFNRQWASRISPKRWLHGFDGCLTSGCSKPTLKIVHLQSVLDDKPLQAGCRSLVSSWRFSNTSSFPELNELSHFFRRFGTACS